MPARRSHGLPPPFPARRSWFCAVVATAACADVCRVSGNEPSARVVVVVVGGGVGVEAVEEEMGAGVGEGDAFTAGGEVSDGGEMSATPLSFWPMLGGSRISSSEYSGNICRNLAFELLIGLTLERGSLDYQVGVTDRLKSCDRRAKVFLSESDVLTLPLMHCLSTTALQSYRVNGFAHPL
jgi:hypothetical protein